MCVDRSSACVSTPSGQRRAMRITNDPDGMFQENSVLVMTT
jgi:hypothetical protein